MIERLVVGLNGSDTSRAALQWVTRFAADEGSDVVAVNVITIGDAVGHDLVVNRQGSWRQRREQTMAHDWVEPLRDAGLNVSCRVVEGEEVVDGLSDAADDADADLIVVGTSGHGQLSERIVGSIPLRLAHRAHQPVVIVPQGWHPTPRASA